MKTKHPWLVQVGKSIEQARRSKGLSQEELADFAQMDRTYIGGIERGERNVSTVNLIRIAATLDIEVGALFPPIEHLRRTSGS